MSWDVEINDVTEAMAQADRIRDNPDLWERDMDESDLIPVFNRRYTTRARAERRIDQFCSGLSSYMVFEHTATDDEVYLRCLGQRPTDPDPRIFEITARSN